MAEAVHIIDVEAIDENQSYENILTNAFPKLCPNMIRQLVHSSQKDLVELVTHLSGLDVEAQRQTIFEEARAFMQTADNAEANTSVRQKRRCSQIKKYTSEFNVEEFVELFPNPEETFNNPGRGNTAMSVKTLNYVEHYFTNKYPFIYKSYITSLLNTYRTAEGPEYNGLLKIDEKLASAQASGLHVMKCRRKPTPMKSQPGDDILILQELAYLEHRTEVQDYIQRKKQEEVQRKQYAIDNGLTITCQCCFTDELMPEEVYACNNDCSFCVQCIQKSCELKLGEDNIQFPCLADCGSQFAWTTLQAALPPTLFSKLSQHCTESEIRAAGIKLDSCPFCNFTNIIDDRYTLFQCLNPDCMKETCRLCKEPSHLPLRCDEVEKDEDVKARIHVENKMTDALLRSCWRCNRKFIKDEDGCNKITCVCGAMSCYVCNKPVQSYKHFNGLGGDQHHLCPLYVDMNAMHQQEIAKAVEEAKKEINPDRLKVDPSADINEYFEDKKKAKPPRWIEAYRDMQNAMDNQERARNNLEQFEPPRIPTRAHPRVPAPAQRQVPAPAQPQVPAPAQRQVPAPAQPQVPAPAQPQVPAPAQPQVPAPAQRQVPAPAQPQVPAPAQPQVPAPAQRQVPAPAQPQVPAPARPRVPAMVQLQVPAPAQLQVPAPARPRVPAMVQLHLPAATERQVAAGPQRPIIIIREEYEIPPQELGQVQPLIPRPIQQHPQIARPIQKQVQPPQHRATQVQAAALAQAERPTVAGQRRPAEDRVVGPSQKRVGNQIQAQRPVVTQRSRATQFQVSVTTEVRTDLPAMPLQSKSKPAQARTTRPNEAQATRPLQTRRSIPRRSN